MTDSVESVLSTWIPIEAKQPEKSEDYLVNSSDRGVEAARYFADDKKWQTIDTYGFDSSPEDLHNVMHWMPFPDPPTQQALSPSPTPAQAPVITVSRGAPAGVASTPWAKPSPDSATPAQDAIFIWSCSACRMRVQTVTDFHINQRPVCVQCNAEMEPDKAAPRRMMLSKNSANPHYKETHLENSWCARAGCTPVCETAATTGKGEQG